MKEQKIDLSGLNIKPCSLGEFAKNFLKSIDQDLCKPSAETCKYESTFNRGTIEHAFGLLKEVIQRAKDVQDEKLVGILTEADRILMEKEALDTLAGFKKEFYRWYDNESPLGKLEAYFEVFTISNTARRAIRSLATAYMRFTNFEPDFTQNEAIRFLRSRHGNSHTRKTYSQFLRTFFKAQGIRKDDLPFEYDRIRVADEDRPKRKTLSYDKVKHFIYLIKASGNPKAGFYGSLITTYGFRPIELGRITIQNIDTEKHTITVQTAKHGRERVHYIPEPIRPYIYGYEPAPISDKQMWRLWQCICRDIGFRPPKGYGWYGIRHALFTNLVNKSRLPAMVLDKWGGWRTGQVSGAGMVNIYHAPDTSDMQELDREVLLNHPFLGFWDGK